MMLACFRELTDLEIAGLAGCVILSLILVVAVRALIRTGAWKHLVPVKYKDFSVPLPLLLVLMVVPFLPLVGAGSWLRSTFPTKSISFYGKSWTLDEIKEHLEEQSKIRLDLQGKAASFPIERKVSGACASDLVNSICELYRSELNCEHDTKSHTFTISLRR
jgi:hypothetical protein